MTPDAVRLRESCLFCDPGGQGQGAQILLVSDNLYIFAGLGAILEGYLIIATRTCKASGGPGASISDLPLDIVDELAFLRGMVSAFYYEMYGHPGLSFEHGRAGVCRQPEIDTLHCYHPHLCCYPGKPGEGFPQRLWEQFALPNRRKCHGVHTIRSVVGALPYLYVEHFDFVEGGNPRGMPSESLAFIVPDEGTMDSQYLRRKLALLVGDEEKWDWARFPTRDRVERVTNAFSRWLGEHATEYAVEYLEGAPPRIHFEDSVAALNALGYEQLAEKFTERWQDALQYHNIGRFLSHIRHDESSGGPKIRLLDLGCGPGLYSKVFAGLGFECVAVDSSAAMLREARRHLASVVGAVSLVRGRAEDVATAVSGPYDAIWCSALLLHLPRSRARRVLRALRELLADDGILYVSTRLVLGGDGSEIPALETRREGRVFVYFRQAELQELFESESLRVLGLWPGTTTASTSGEQHKKHWCHFLLSRRRAQMEMQ